MLRTIGFIASVVLGYHVGKWIFDFFKELREDARHEEDERINAHLKRQMKEIVKREQYEADLAEAESKLKELKWRKEHKIPITDFSDTTRRFPSWTPEDGVLLTYRGKLLTYRSDKGWVFIEDEPEKATHKVIKDLWYGTGGYK